MRGRRAEWQELRESLVSTTRTWEAVRQFEALRRRSPLVARFEGCNEMVQWMHRAGENLDEKDRVLAALVTSAQAGAPESDLAAAALWLSVWPGLDHRCYRRHVRSFENEPDELVSIVTSVFTSVISRIDLRRVSRVAATLVRNTERRVVAACRKSWKDAASEMELPSPDGPVSRTAARRWAESPLVTLPPEHGESDAPKTTVVAELVRRLAGDDAEIVMRVAIRRETQASVARSMGLKPGTLRKRYQRALTKARAALSHSGAPARVSRPKGQALRNGRSR